MASPLPAHHGIHLVDAVAEGGAGRAPALSLRRFRWIWTTFMVLATSVPYLLFWLQTPVRHRYTWILPPYPEDSFGYMAWSQQAARGSWLFQIKYTALPHAAFLFHPFFLLCGWISRLTGAGVGFVQFAAKALGIVLFFLAFYAYTDWLGLSRAQSIFASVLVGVSSGVGGLCALLHVTNRWGILPADLWMPEVSTFWSLLWNPLFPYSLTAIVLACYWLDRGTREARQRDFWFSGLASGALALLHPYAVPFLLAYAAILTIARLGVSGLRFLLRFLTAAFPFLFYVALLSKLNPVVSRHNAQGEMKSPSLLAYLLAFGIPVLICAGGLLIGRTPFLKKYGQLFLWMGLALALAYSPFWFQRKLIFGAHIPLCILAAISLDLILTKYQLQVRRAWVIAMLAIALVALLISTPVYQLFQATREVHANRTGAYYLTDEMVNGLSFLKNHAKPNEIVFASWETSRLIPAFAGNTVLWGHWAMSVDLVERRQWLAQIFSQPNSRGAQGPASFWGSGISYIYADGGLKASIEQNPDQWELILKDADRVFANDSVVIYRHRTREE